MLPALQRGNNGILVRAIRRYLRAYPNLASLTPALLDRGDPVGLLLALYTAGLLRTPPLLTALRHFTAIRRGPADLQMLATTPQAGARNWGCGVLGVGGLG